ncbi:molybdate ABC transporter ATP-binding protein ModF [Desulfosarcina alkanivorans]|uniref:Molybdate ABC transporter ATP-binding protein ModF n=1 Tax=Desulfosarcina alkanivorans TaxID=571177 RepID=A0A5K7YI40_9BACT|nr:ATP-binding cassette domain-containing protein [Desulfosarcina alkanivorans]BBO67760.1 molybdate ABC transporter ATP-binding protein ModF [Desulfosarcina alkanivorans]
MTTPLITVDGIAVRLRDRWLLDGSSWRINAGEQWVVTGPNGAGKTTLAKAVAGLLPVVQGNICYHAFDGIPPVDAIAYVASDARRDIWRRESVLDHARGFAGRFGDATTVRELIGPQAGDCIPPADMADRLADVAGRLGLAPLMDKPVLAVSTGEMSRVLVARALMRRPRMLILDEPYEGLDRWGRKDLRDMLDGLAIAGLPMILVTHRHEEVPAACTHLLTVEQGRIASAGPVARPLHAAVPTAAGLSADGAPDRPIRCRAHPGEHRPLSSETLIDMQAVTVRYGETTVLDRLTWVVKAGQHWAVTGPNGAGKSTILKLITGECLQVYGNRIRLFGRGRGTDQSLWEIRERLGVVSHDLAAGYQKRMSVLDVVCSGFFDSVGLYRHPDSGQIETARGWLAQVGISSLGHAPFNQLSQGQRQLVLILRAVVKSPQLLILDEPCAGLDAENRRRVLDLVTHIAARGATGLIFVSHHKKEIPACTTHRLYLEHGIVVGCGGVWKE